MELVFILYMALGYWAVGEVVYRNMTRVGTPTSLFLSRVVLGTVIGFIVIPIAVIMSLCEKKS